MVSTSGLNRLAQVLAEWRRRLAGVRSALFFHPEHSEAWIWRIRQRVLDYLLKRYSGVDRDRPVPPDESGPIVYRPRGDGKQPRRGGELSGVLTDLHSTNRARYDNLISTPVVATPWSHEMCALYDSLKLAIYTCKIEPPVAVYYEDHVSYEPSWTDAKVLDHLAGLLCRCGDPKADLVALDSEFARLRKKYPNHFARWRLQNPPLSDS